MAVDYLVDCKNPESLDKILQGWNAVLCNTGNEGQYVKQDGYYIMRVMGANEGFIKFAIDNQGYGKVIKKIEQLT